MATLSINDMREVVESAYASSSWVRKVRDMPDVQVIAIYRKIIERVQKQPLKPARMAPEKTVDVLVENQLSFL